MSLRAVRIILLALIAAELALLVLGPQKKDHAAAIQAAEAACKRPDWWDDAAMGIRYAAWVNVGLLSLLLASAKRWARSNAKSGTDARLEGPSRPPNSKLRTPKWFWPCVLFATLTCLALRLPLATKSLWWDEAWVLQQVDFGKWKEDAKKPGGYKFIAHDWSRAAWYYQKPTNHVPMSLLQKASLTTWQKLTHAKRSEFSDLAARVPALIASCLSVLLLACLLRAWGGRPGAGVAAAFLLALHPWHIRYGVDARAYALVVPLCIGGMLAVTRIVKSSGTKFLPLACFGLVEFIWLWAYPNALLDVAALNLVCAVLLWNQCKEKSARINVLWRLIATNVFAAACLIQVFLPNLMQARHWAGQEADKHLLDGDLFVSTISQLITGREASFPTIPEAAGLAPLSTQSSTGFHFIFAALFCLMLVSRSGLLLARWRTKRETPQLILSALVFSAFLFALTTLALHSYFYPRFAIALLPVVITLFCYDVDRSKFGRWFAAPIALLALVIWLPQQKVLATRAYEPLHDVALFVQSQAIGTTNPPLIACYGLGREIMPVYEPRCLPLETKPEVERLLQRAQAERRPLYVIYGYNTFNRSTENEPHRILAEGFQLLDDHARFEEVAAFPGIDPEFYFRVLKAK